MHTPTYQRRIVEALAETATAIEKYEKMNWFGFKAKEVERDNMLQFLYCHQALLAHCLSTGESLTIH